MSIYIDDEVRQVLVEYIESIREDQRIMHDQLEKLTSLETWEQVLKEFMADYFSSTYSPQVVSCTPPEQVAAKYDDYDDDYVLKEPTLLDVFESKDDGYLEVSSCESKNIESEISVINFDEKDADFHENNTEVESVGEIDIDIDTFDPGYTEYVFDQKDIADFNNIFCGQGVNNGIDDTECQIITPIDNFDEKEDIDKGIGDVDVKIDTKSEKDTDQIATKDGESNNVPDKSTNEHADSDTKDIEKMKVNTQTETEDIIFIDDHPIDTTPNEPDYHEDGDDRGRNLIYDVII